jgi:alanine-alpha-ketoisovalerate/valine-pyruvate aminotransferase
MADGHSCGLIERAVRAFVTSLQFPWQGHLVPDEARFDPATALAGAQFAYTVPNFSNPTGRLVGVSTRQALVDAAHASGTWLVEDDPYGGLHYDGAPLPRMIELSGRKGGGQVYGGPVVYMGTLSKEVAPGLRIGWVVAAPAMIEALISEYPACVEACGGTRGPPFPACAEIGCSRDRRIRAQTLAQQGLA